MGLDGGTYATRSDVLRRQSSRMAQTDTSRSTRGGAVSTSSTYKEQSVDDRTHKIVQCSTCHMSGQPLAQPIVCDLLGNLYNKDAVLEFFLSRKKVYVDGDASLFKYLNTQQAAGHKFDQLQSMKDVFQVELAANTVDPPALDGSPPPFRFMCPITLLAFGQHACSALRSCGHVFSDRAINELADQTCPTCSKPFSKTDVVPLYGTPEQLDALKQRLNAERFARERKGMKRKSANKDDGSCKLKVTATEVPLPLMPIEPSQNEQRGQVECNP